MALQQFRTAAAMAAATPATRNRYADFLRAVAILAVVIGHWLMAAAWIDGSGFHAKDILGIVEGTKWLTWLLQVMPLFFLVGGYSNSVGWDHHAGSYPDWLRGRLERLVMPTVPVIGTWAVLGLVGPSLGLDADLARLGSQVALVPMWFLAVYVVMVAATPLTTAAWRRYGGRAVVVMTAAALLTDLTRALTTVHAGIANYAFVWGSITLLGHAWHQGSFANARRGRLLAAIGGTALIAMTVAGPYHVSMVGVPGIEFGNSGPPSAALLALGFTQIGLALAAERTMRRFLDRPRPWTLTVLVNSSIMTLYVWHMTVMVLAIALLLWRDSAVLSLVPGDGTWWITRPLWIGTLGLATLPFLAGFRRFESASRRRESTSASLATSLAATAGVGVSFMAVASHGISTSHPMWAVTAVIPLAGVALWLRSTRRTRDDRELQAS